MTTQPDPTIRGRLRERHVEESGQSYGAAKGWCKFCEQGWPCDTRLALTELDTLERRVRAAEERLDAAIRHGYQRGQADERYQRGDRDELAIRLWRDEERDHATLSEARSLISGTKEPTDG